MIKFKNFTKRERLHYFTLICPSKLPVFWEDKDFVRALRIISNAGRIAKFETCQEHVTLFELSPREYAVFNLERFKFKYLSRADAYDLLEYFNTQV